MYPADRKYTKDHEWIKVHQNKGTVGITHFAQEQLGDIIFVELPSIGSRFKKGEAFGVVESVKSVSDCYAPVTGIVTAVNNKLLEDPALLNRDPHGEGWMIELEICDESELNDLLDATEYEEFLQKPPR